MIKQLSSVGKRILVFSDPHQEMVYLRKILMKENYDEVVCLGDWFDSHVTNSEDALIATCDQLKSWIRTDTAHTCIGNHDISYLYTNPTTICGGFRPSKKDKIGDYFRDAKMDMEEVRAKFQWAIWIDDWFCSHAGVHPNLFDLPFAPPFVFSKDNVTARVNHEIADAMISLRARAPHPFYCAGQARGDGYSIGGITWLDFNEEFVPIEGLKQIVGHTHHRWIVLNKGNYCIDTGLMYYLIIENGEVELKHFADL